MRGIPPHRPPKHLYIPRARPIPTVAGLHLPLRPKPKLTAPPHPRLMPALLDPHHHPVQADPHLFLRPLPRSGNLFPPHPTLPHRFRLRPPPSLSLHKPHCPAHRGRASSASQYELTAWALHTTCSTPRSLQPPSLPLSWPQGGKSLPTSGAGDHPDAPL
jgi:hypothetical protein